MTETVFVFNPEIQSGLKTSDLKASVSNNRIGSPYPSPYGYNTSYSGIDALAIFVTNNGTVIPKNLNVLSYSIHSNKIPVRVLGRRNPKGYTQASRTVAGTMIFIADTDHPLAPLIKMMNLPYAKAEHLGLLADEIEPFDVIIRYTNEYGYYSYLHIYRVEFVDEGQTTSANDLGLEYVFQYIAYDVDILTAFNTEPLKADLTDDAVLSEILMQQLWGDVDFQEAFSTGILPVTGKLITSDDLSVSPGKDGRPEYKLTGHATYNIMTRRELINKWADPHTYPWSPTSEEEFNPSSDEYDPNRTIARSESSIKFIPLDTTVYPPENTESPDKEEFDKESLEINRLQILKDPDGFDYIYWEINGFMSELAIIYDDEIYHTSKFNRGRVKIKPYINIGDKFTLKVWKYKAKNIVIDSADLEQTIIYN